MGTLRFFEEVVSFKIRRTFGFADYKPEKPFPDTRIFYPEKQGISSPVYPTRLYRP